MTVVPLQGPVKGVIPTPDTAKIFYPTPAFQSNFANFAINFANLQNSPNTRHPSSGKCEKRKCEIDCAV